jgi:Uma2 family endonuclease
MSEKAMNQSTKAAANSFMSAAARNNNSPSGAQVIGHAGSDRWHNLIVSNIAIAIGSRMHGHKSEIYIGNMHVKLSSGLSCFPDLTLVTGEPSFTDQSATTLLNPTVIVDVFSSSSDSLEKTKKLENFLEMPSIKECLLVKQDEMRCEHYARQNQKQWIYRIYNERDDVISVDSINCKLSLQEIYAHINFRSAELSSKAVN